MSLFTVQFEKASASGRYVRGWAYVSMMDGKQLADEQGDVIELDELRKAAHDFVQKSRVAKAMHKGSAVGDVVESIIVDDALAKAFGMTDTRRGWFIGMLVEDAAVRKRIRSGELQAFSIGGRGQRKRIDGIQGS